MVNRYYLDACIWRDYFENRSDRFRPLGEWALMFINRMISENNLFVVSDHLLNELMINYTPDKLTSLLKIVPEQLKQEVKTNNMQAEEALYIMNRFKIPFGDALHAIIARDNNAILVTRDKHFFELTMIVSIVRPEDLL